MAIREHYRIPANINRIKDIGYLQKPQNRFAQCISILLFVPFLFISCQDDPDNSQDYHKGKNRYTLTSELTEREYYVHVPEAYTGDSPTPVVFMLHGTSGNGLDMYDRSGWVEVGETENILTVYPSSLRYCIIDPVDGMKTITKWNSQPVEWQFCDPSEAKDEYCFYPWSLMKLSIASMWTRREFI